MSILPETKSFIELILRSKDLGDGWRFLSETLNSHFGPLIEKFPDLFEYDKNIPAVRLTNFGNKLVEYL